MGSDAARLRSLMTISAAVGASRRFEDVLELAAEEACAALGAASLSISRWEPDRGVLRTLINVGELGPGEERFPADETYDVQEFSAEWEHLSNGHVFRRQAGQPLPDGTTLDLLEKLGKGSEAATTIRVGGLIWGELWATTAIGQLPFSESDGEFLEAVANQVSAGLASATYLARLETLAFTDPLTGLANRRDLDERLAAELEEGRPLAVVVCDLDGLKEINDRDGHAAGDQAIVAVAGALGDAVGAAGLAARIGGDEFCLLVPGDADGARAVAQRAVDLLTSRHSGVTMSCGVASTAVAQDAAGLLAAADAAQYAAKHGSDAVIVAERTPTPARRSLERRRLRNRLDLTALLAQGSGSAGDDTLVQRVVQAAREHLGMELSFVAEFTGDQMTFRHVSAAGATGVVEGLAVPLDQTLCQGIQELRAPLVLPNTGADERFREVANAALMRAYVGVPIVLDDGRLYGTLCCASSRTGQGFTDGEVRFLRVLASIVGSLVGGDGTREHQRRQIRDRIARLLRERSLSMVFQPVRDLRDGRLVGVEALARFGVLGADAPDRWFLEAAEVGLGVDLELAALQAALAELPRIPAGAFLSVNVSPDALCSPGLPAVVATADPRRLVLELTEHAPVRDYDRLSAALGELRAQGIRFAVDDAGAGYASLAHILRLAPDLIKLDLLLTRGIDTDPVRRALAVALRDFAEGIGATIVAEGIETAAELGVLTELGIPLGQGFRLGRPGPVADLAPTYAARAGTDATHASI